jgi:hypothetical protein
MLSHRTGAQVIRVVNGVDDQPAAAHELQSLPVESTWGLQFSLRLAERVFVQREPLVAGVGSPFEHSRLLTSIDSHGRITQTVTPKV